MKEEGNLPDAGFPFSVRVSTKISYKNGKYSVAIHFFFPDLSKIPEYIKLFLALYPVKKRRRWLWSMGIMRCFL